MIKSSVSIYRKISTPVYTRKFVKKHIYSLKYLILILKIMILTIPVRTRILYNDLVLRTEKRNKITSIKLALKLRLAEKRPNEFLYA